MKIDIASLLPGTRVLFYDNPFATDGDAKPTFGFVAIPPGAQTATLLVWANESGWIEKHSVRMKDDPFWKQSEMAPSWGKWGCFEVHPEVVAVWELTADKTKTKSKAA